MKRLAALALIAVSASAVAHSDDPRANAIEYRQSVYHAIRWNWMPLAQMVKGEKPFDRAEFVKRATRVSFLSHQLLEGYPEGSHEGAETDALPQIWENWPDFTAKLGDLRREAQVLRVTAADGDEAAIKAQFVKTAGTCKACHDEYRAD